MGIMKLGIFKLSKLPGNLFETYRLKYTQKSFCLFELIMMIQAFKINKSVLSFLVFCVLKFDCFSLLPFVLSLLLLTIEGLFRAKIHNSA